MKEMASCCEYGNEYWDCIKCGEYFCLAGEFDDSHFVADSLHSGINFH
jgi:hypothetical protein